MIEKLRMQTPNGADEKFRLLAELFPNAITETLDDDGTPVRAIDKDVLAQEINTRVLEGREERYQFTWPDKRKAIAIANERTSMCLRPCREESVNFDTTENLYIEGDNLKVLKVLRESYMGKVKMIYIDPPYNTGKDFVYRDNFALDGKEYQENSGQFDDEGNSLVQNTESNGRYHTDWLNFMYSRLKVARELLTDDGVIAISIDEHEIDNLLKLCNEVYGEVNNLNPIVWDKRNPKGDAHRVAQQHEYIVLYSKDFNRFCEANYFFRKKEHGQMMLNKASALVEKYGLSSTMAENEYKKWISVHKTEFSGGESAYCFIDEHGRVYRPVSMAAPDKPENRSHRPLIHPKTTKPCPVPAKGWRFTDAAMDNLVSAGLILFGPDESTQPSRKYLLSENLQESVPSLLYFGGSGLIEGIPFDNPKPVTVLKRLIESITGMNELILDFFSGSATTAHAVMQLNAEDGGNRKFIMVQLQEECDEKSEAYKAGYKNICEIGKERIRRAGKKIREEMGLQAQGGDMGFRVLKCDSSNMEEVFYTPAEAVMNPALFKADNVKPDRSAMDLLFQVMPELNIPLSARIAKVTLGGREMLCVNEGYLLAALDGELREDAMRAAAAQGPVYFVTRDSALVNDAAAANLEQIFKTISPGSVLRVL